MGTIAFLVFVAGILFGTVFALRKTKTKSLRFSQTSESPDLETPRVNEGASTPEKTEEQAYVEWFTRKDFVFAAQEPEMDEQAFVGTAMMNEEVEPLHTQEEHRVLH